MSSQNYIDDTDDELEIHLNKPFIANYNNGLLCIGSSFDSFKELYDAAVEFAKQAGFTLSFTSHYFTDFQMMKEYNTILDPKPLRNATFYCSDCKPLHFKIYVSYCIKQKKLVIRNDGYQLEHNHPLKRDLNSTFITKTSDLSSDEINKIEMFIHSDIPCYLIKKLIKVEFNKDISSKLVFNLKYKVNKIVYGENEAGADHLQDLSKKIIEQGGMFKFRFNNHFKLKSIMVMDKYMIDFCQAFSDVVIVDGTHKCTDSDMVVIAFTTIHPIGCNILLGIVVAHSENSNDIINGLKDMGIRKGSTLISDEGGWFSKVTEEMEMNHILCRWHFNKKVERYLKGLSEEEKEEIKSIFNETIYNARKDEVNSNIEKLKSKYSQNARLVSLIDSFSYTKHKLCNCYTQEINTLGIQSTSRAESFNSILKRFENISNFNLFQLIQHILNINENIVLNIQQSVNKSVSNGISKFVLRYIDDEAAALHKVKLRAVDIEAGIYSLVDDSFDTIVVVHYSRGTAKIPCCSCPFFTSKRILCRHIISVLNHNKVNPRKNQNLELRWRLSSCPILSHSSTREPKGNEKITEPNEKIKVPDTEIARYAALKSITDEIPTQFCKREDRFLEAVQTLTGLLNHGHQNKNKFMPIIPAKRRRSWDNT